MKTIRIAILGVGMLGFAFTNFAAISNGAEDLFEYQPGHPKNGTPPVERLEAEANCPNAGLTCAINTENENDVIFWDGSTSKF